MLLLSLGVTTSRANATENLRPDQLGERLTPFVTTALAAHGLQLVALAARTTTWTDISADARVASATLVGEPLNLASIEVDVTVVDAESTLSRRVRCQVVADGRVVVATRALAPGDRLLGAVRLAPRRLDGPLSGLLGTDLDDLPLLRARRRVERGEVLRGSDVRRAPDVTAGESVQVRTTVGELTLNLSGTAMRDARRGETVPIVVFAGGRVIDAVVVGPHRAEVRKPSSPGGP